MILSTKKELNCNGSAAPIQFTATQTRVILKFILKQGSHGKHSFYLMTR